MNNSKKKILGESKTVYCCGIGLKMYKNVSGKNVKKNQLGTLAVKDTIGW